MIMIQEERLKEAQRLYETANADQRYVLESLFPELKESEDGRICRQLIGFLKQCKAVYGDGFKQFGLNIEDALTWLEKQSSDDEKYQQGWHDALEKQDEQKPIKRKDFISIPFGTDSELVNETITIPDGCVATIEGNKIHIKKK